MFIEEKTFNTINNLFKDMDIPDWRKEKNTIDNLKWIQKNLYIRNKNKPNYEKVMCVIKSVLEGMGIK
jgi:hypothetical protein